MPWTCYMIESTDREKRYLRRFTWQAEGHCPAHPRWGHDARVLIDEAPMPPKPAEDDGPFHERIVKEWPHDDRRWPAQCACGYEFQDTDQWRLHTETIYRRLDTGAEMTIKDAPIGAMYDAWWLHDMKSFRVVDGHTLMVKLPGGGEWCIDGESVTGGFWQRSGKAPKITARPSILHPGVYHGWLTDGVLSDDIEGRHYA